MKSFLADEFFDYYLKLPEEVRERARAAYKLWKENPFHPSLRFKKVHPVEELWSARISRDWRVLGLREGDEITWFWIGSHSDYNTWVDSW